MRYVFKVRTFGCEACGQTVEALRWDYDPPPDCACGGAMHETHARPKDTVQIITDDVPGGFVVENGFSQPTRFDSKSAHRKALEANGMRIADRGEFRI